MDLRHPCSSWIFSLVVVLYGCGASPENEENGDAGGMPAPGCEEVLPPGDHQFTLPHGGIQYTYRIHVPEGYDGSPSPVLFNVHGFNTTPGGQAVFSAMNPDAGSRGYLVVYPGAPDLAWNGGWCCGVAAEQDHDDIGFFRALVAELPNRICVDPKRVYVTGMSNGGMMTHRLGCEAADLFAAIAPVAGTMAITECQPARPVPVMHFHGTADSAVPYEGDENHEPVLTTMQNWADRNGCTGDPVETYSNGAAVCMTFQNCDAGAEVVNCKIEGMEHCWPGNIRVCPSEERSDDILANIAMLDFFDRFRLE